MGLSDEVLVPDLPDLAAQKLVQNFTDSSIFQLVSLASVCSLWRTFVKELEITHLSLETTLNVKGDASVGPMLKKFRKLRVEEKTRFYEAVTLLLKRQKSVLCTGEAISDKIVISLANPSLQRLTLEGCTKVTDYSLSILLLRCPDLQELHLKNMSAICGAFLPAMLLQGRCLESLSLQNLSGPDWSLPFESFSNNNSLPGLKTLTLENVRLDKGTHSFFRCFPRLKYLSIDSCPACVRSAANYCPELEEVVLNVDNSGDLDNCLTVLVSAPSLRILELSPFTFKLTHNQMRVVGILNLTELRLESPSFKHQPLNRIAPCHLDNDGVKVLVDTICQRKLLQPGRQPFKLSLCGAASISHDAVSALLRLPLLSGLSLDGCSRISSIDKMRLIAKVKAGRELLDGKLRQKTRREAFGLLDHCRSI